MDKIINNHKTNLIIIFICYILAIVFNLHLFSFSNIYHLLYGIVMIILAGMTLYVFILINTNIQLSTKISMIIGPIMAIMNFIEGFMYGEGLIVNFRVARLFIMIGGILIFNSSRKIKKSIYEEM